MASTVRCFAARPDVLSRCADIIRSTSILTQGDILIYKDIQQKTRTVYISGAQLPEARRMLANYTKIRKLIGELFETNIALFKMRSKL